MASAVARRAREAGGMKRGIVVGAVGLASLLATVAPVDAGASTKSYVVLVKEGLDPATVATADGVAPTQVWDEVGGFAADLTNQQVNRLRGRCRGGVGGRGRPVRVHPRQVLTTG